MSTNTRSSVQCYDDFYPLGLNIDVCTLSPARHSKPGPIVHVYNTIDPKTYVLQTRSVTWLSLQSLQCTYTFTHVYNNRNCTCAHRCPWTTNKNNYTFDTTSHGIVYMCSIYKLAQLLHPHLQHPQRLQCTYIWVNVYTNNKCPSVILKSITPLMCTLERNVHVYINVSGKYSCISMCTVAPHVYLSVYLPHRLHLYILLCIHVSRWRRTYCTFTLLPVYALFYGVSG